MLTIELTRGLSALVDDEDYDRLMVGTKWRAASNDGNVYAIRNVRKPDGRYTTESMHQVITGWRLTDHRDHNGLNNQRYNLREATGSQNQGNFNSRSGASKYKGVSPHVQGRWQATIGINGKSKYLGLFDSEIEAAIAYNDAALDYFGEFAYLNEVTR